MAENLSSPEDTNREKGEIKRIKKNVEKVQFSSQYISWQGPIVILAAGCFLFYLVYLQDNNLPRVISKDEAIENPELFSGERSRTSLLKLTKLGQRVVGNTANEVYAPAIIEKDVLEAMANAHSSQSILMERQKGSGMFALTTNYSPTSIYIDVQNIIVMIEGSEGNYSVLINCHYDSVYSSEGASDDAVNCAVMMELIRVLSVSKTRLKHNIVFLFNGAEETGLQAAHMFLQHEWSKKCKVILNLEAVGQGRAMVFQTGPENNWIFGYYSKYAPHPHAQVFTEELFQNGFIPSDTDFRVFRDFGRMAGMDFAFGRNAYVYHTSYDQEQYILHGSHQHLGDNLLAMLRELGNAPEFYDLEKYADGETVYYDYLGWFMIDYSAEGGIALNICMVIFAIFTIVLFIGRLLQWPWLVKSSKTVDDTMARINVFKRKSSKESENLPMETVEQIRSEDDPEPSKDFTESDSGHNLNTAGSVLLELGITFVTSVLAQILGIITVVIISLIIDAAATLAMPWYSNVWLIFPFYWCPCLIVHTGILYLVDLWRKDKRGLSTTTTVHLNVIAHQMQWILILFILTCGGVRSAQVFLLPVIFGSLSNIIVQQTPLRKTKFVWIFIYLIVHIPSLLYTLYTSLMVYVLLIPISARSGTINGDLYVGLVTSLVTLYVAGFAVPLMGLVKKRYFTLLFLTCFSVLTIIIALTTWVGQPYKAGPGSPAPQRYWIMHTDREFYNVSQMLSRRETGYFILNLDRNSPRTVPLKGRSMRYIQSDCEEVLNCGLPYYSTRMIPLSPTSSWIAAPAPYIPQKTELILKSRCLNSSDESLCSIELSLKGPDRMSLAFSPRSGAELISWSLPTPTNPTREWNGRFYYFMSIVRGEITGDFDVSLTFKVTPDQKSGDPIVDLGLSGNHVHHESDRTEEFQNFLDSFPDWTTMIGWISAYRAHVF